MQPELSPKRSLTPPEINNKPVPLERISAREALERHHPSRDQFLDKMGVPSEDRDFLRPIVAELGYEKAFYTIALGNLLGISARRTPEYFRRHMGQHFEPELQGLEHLNTEGEWSGMRISPESVGKSFRKNGAGSDRIKVFDAEFRSFPGLFGRRIDGAPGGSELFVMNVPDSDLRAIQKSAIDGELDHAFNSFGFIRFYRSDEGFHITEIQSDVFGRIEQRNLREKYKHWAKLMVLAFERFAIHENFAESVSSLGTDQFRSERVVTFPSADTIRKRWPDYPVDSPIEAGYTMETPVGDFHFGYGIADALAKRLYWDLPLEMGFESHPGGRRFIERNPFNEPVQEQYVWQKPLNARMLLGPWHGNTGELFEDLPQDPDYWLQKKEELLPHQITVDRSSLPRVTAFPALKALRIGRELYEPKEIELAPANRIELDTLFGLRRQALPQPPQHQLLQERVRGVLPHGLAFFGNTQLSDTALVPRIESEEVLHFFHPADFLRGPTIQVIDENPLFIECLGGGGRLDDAAVGPSQEGQPISPFPQIRSTTDMVTRLRPRQLVETYAAGLKSLEHLYSMSSISGKPVVPTLVEIGVFDSIPTWRGGEIDWIDPSTFCQRFLDSPSPTTGLWPGYALIAYEGGVRTKELMQLAIGEERLSTALSSIATDFLSNREERLTRLVSSLGVLHGAGGCMLEHEIDTEGRFFPGTLGPLIPHILEHYSPRGSTAKFRRDPRSSYVNDLRHTLKQFFRLNSFLGLYCEEGNEESLRSELNGQWNLDRLFMEVVRSPEEILGNGSLSAAYLAARSEGESLKEEWGAYR